MKLLNVEFFEKGVLSRSGSHMLRTGKSTEFINALVLLCNELGIEVPVLTYKRDKTLMKQNEVTFQLDDTRLIKISLL